MKSLSKTINEAKTLFRDVMFYDILDDIDIVLPILNISQISFSMPSGGEDGYVFVLIYAHEGGYEEFNTNITQEDDIDSDNLQDYKHGPGVYLTTLDIISHNDFIKKLEKSGNLDLYLNGDWVPELDTLIIDKARKILTNKAKEIKKLQDTIIKLVDNETMILFE